MAPSSHHGVTTVAMGNCGVGFAPVAPGSPRLAHRHHGGSRGHPRDGAARGPAVGLGVVPRVPGRPRAPTADHRRRHPCPPRRPAGFRDGGPGRRPRRASRRGQLDAMASLLAEGLEAGALGVSTSRTERHRTSTGREPRHPAGPEPELLALAGLRASGTGVFQFLCDSYRTTDDYFAQAEFDLITAFARTSRPPGQLYRPAGRRGARTVARPDGTGRTPHGRGPRREGPGRPPAHRRAPRS